MKKASSRTLAVVLCALACAIGCSGERSALDGPDPATVLLITVDTLRADRIGTYGKTEAGTPAMDELGAAGVVFESAHTTAPLTLPAHASILSGRSVPAHGVRNNGTYALSPDIPTLAESFKKSGWATGAFVSAQVLARRHGLDRGFDRYDDKVGDLEGARGLVAHYVERPGTVTVDRAVTWTLQHADTPVMAWVHLWEPHIPYAPPPPFAEQFPDDRYQGEVAAADAAIKRLVDGVRAAGRQGPLLVVITSDHGESLWEHDEETHGLFLYRSVMRVPLIVSGPDWGIRPSRLAQPVSVADIAPTLTELCDLEPLDGADGLTLAAAMRDGTPLTRRGVFAESWLPKIDFQWSGLRALVTDDEKFIQAPIPELYDVAADPGEQNNLLETADRSADDLVRLLGEFVEDGLDARPDGEALSAASEEELAALRSLGYAATGAVATDDQLVDPDGVDPKQRIEVIAKHDQAVKWLVERKPKQAESILREALEIDAENPALLFQLSAALALQGKLEQSEPVLEKLVRLQPESGFAWLRYAQVLAAMGKTEQHVQALARAVEVDPYNEAARTALERAQNAGP